MSNYTYEFENRGERLETYEWDNVWWEHAKTEGVPRVLYIGDSISCGTRKIATAAAEERIFFDGFGTSKALDNPYFAESLHLFAEQQGGRRAVLFNNGLHGWHLCDETDYVREYEKMIGFLLREFAGTPILLLLSTHLADPARDARVQARNRGVVALAEKYGLPVVDLYALTAAHADLLLGDGVHWTPEGYRLIADELIRRVEPYLS